MPDETQETPATKHSDVLSTIAAALSELNKAEPHSAVEDAIRHVESAAATLADHGI